MLKYIALALALIVASPAAAQSLNGNTIPPGSINPFPAQSPNTVYAGPTSGANAFPSFRALVPADIPTGSATRNLNWLSPADPQFGAKCDGTTDDHTALTAWAAALVSGKAGYVPGVCLTSTALTFPTGRNISLFGNGTNSELRYTGAATTGNIFTFGSYDPTTCNASATNNYISNILFSSATVMTGGSGVYMADMCNLVINNVHISNNDFQSSNWYTALEIAGGNEIFISNYLFIGTYQGAAVHGDTLGAHPQLTDIYFEGPGKIAFGVHAGMNVCGNVGGFVADSGDWLGNGTNLRISQDCAAFPNAQIFLGPKLFLDFTQAGDGHGLEITDPGSNNSQLNLTGTWIASSGSTCFLVLNNVNWVVNWTGGNLVNCGGDGIGIQTGATISGIITGVSINATAGGFGAWTGYGVDCGSQQTNLVIENIKFISSPTSGLNNGCILTSYFPPNGNSPIFTVPLDNTTGPATSWQYDTSGQGVIAVANAASATLPVSASGLVMVTNQTDGNVGVYLCGGGACALTSQSKTSFDTSTTTPTAGKASVAWTGSAYAIYNNTGASVNFNASLFKTRNST